VQLLTKIKDKMTNSWTKFKNHKKNAKFSIV